MSQPVVHRSASTHRAFKISPADSNYFAFTADPHADGTAFVQVIEIFEIEQVIVERLADQ